MIFTDQLQQTFTFNQFPKRIISIVPSQTELIWDLGIRDELVGITKFCIHPTNMHQTIAHVGGTKTLNIELIKSLQPDLIIGNKEENEKSQIEAFQHHFPVWISDIYTLNDALEMIQGIGNLLNKENEGAKIVSNILNSFGTLPQIDKRVLYFIWRKPYMVAGRNTFIGDLLQRLGLQNCIKEIGSRYPTLSIDELKKYDPELILLSSEPYPFSQKHLEELQQHLPNTTIQLVDGEAFSWYGSRLLHSMKEFEKIAIL